MTAQRSNLAKAAQPAPTGKRDTFTITEKSRRQKARGARAEQAHRRLYFFVKYGWHVLEGVKFDANWHIEAICDEVQFLLEGWLVGNGHCDDATDKSQKRIKDRIIRHFWRLGLTFREGMLLVQNAIFNVPPSSLKSRIIMVFGPAWLWLHAPNASFGCSSGTDENVRRDSEAHHKLVASEWYRTWFAKPGATTIEWTVPKVAAIGFWENSAGGSRMSRTFLAGWTGTHSDILLFDDPDDAHKVWSEAQRKRTQDQLSNALESRVNHEMKCLRVISQQRVHVDDTTAYARRLKQWSVATLTGWALFCIPMEFGKGPKDAPKESASGWVDPRTEEGDLIHPERFGPDNLADKRVAMTDLGVDAQYNQNPDDVTGGLIARTDIRFFRIAGGEDHPRKRPDGCTDEQAFVLGRKTTGRDEGELDLDFLDLTIDSTFGSLDEKTASAVGALLVGGKGLRRFVLDDQTKPRTFDDTKEMIRQFIRTWRIGTVLIEKKANGATVISDLERELAEGVIVEHADGRLTREPLLWPNGDRALVKLVAVETGSDSKVGRAMPMIPEYKCGLIFVLDGASWLPAHVAEVCRFPKGGTRDDRIDAMSQLQAHRRDAKQGLTRAIALARW